jgi:putative flippase GtrA
MLHKLIKFGLIGGMNTVFDFVIFNCVAHVLGWSFFGLDPEITAQLVSGFILVPISFTLNYKWTFKSDKSKRKTLPIYFLCTYFSVWIIQPFAIWLVCFPIGDLGMKDFWFFTGNWVLYTNFAKCVACAFGMIWNFTSYHFIFKEKSTQNEEKLVR